MKVDYHSAAVSDSEEQPTLSRFEIQDREYAFPYHYLPHIDRRGAGVRHRRLNWGLEYLCYLRHLAIHVASLAPASLLDVGCGDGRFISLLPAAIDTTGVDLSAQAIAFAQAFQPDKKFLLKDAATLDTQFDLVSAIEVLEHVPDEHVSSFLQTLSARTRAGGNILISVPTKVMKLTRKHYRHYDLELLQRQLSDAGLQYELVKVDYIYRDSRLFDAALKFLSNGFWSLAIKPVDRLLWWWVWRVLRPARPANARHLAVTLRKPV